MTTTTFRASEPQRCGHRDRYQPGCVCCEMDYAGMLTMQETGKCWPDYTRAEKRAGLPYADTLKWLSAEGITPQRLNRMTVVDCDVGSL